MKTILFLAEEGNPPTMFLIVFLLNLQDVSENCMVRHECAEALGSIATEECMKVLDEYKEDKEAVVKESCEVALDMCEYEKSDSFQYADAYLKLQQSQSP